MATRCGTWRRPGDGCGAGARGQRLRDEENRGTGDAGEGVVRRGSLVNRVVSPDGSRALCKPTAAHARVQRVVTA